MSEMVERVAKAIMRAEGRDAEQVDAWKRPMWRKWEKAARAAIAAMREPKTFIEVACGVIGEKRVAEILNRPFESGGAAAPDGVAFITMAHPWPEGVDPADYTMAKRVERDGAPDMSTMLGRVWARIINNVGKDLTPKEEARRILEVMREPTEAMVSAMVVDHDIQGVNYLRGPAAYTAGIDAALKEP